MHGSVPFSICPQESLSLVGSELGALPCPGSLSDLGVANGVGAPPLSSGPHLYRQEVSASNTWLF